MIYIVLLCKVRRESGISHHSPLLEAVSQATHEGGSLRPECQVRDALAWLCRDEGFSVLKLGQFQVKPNGWSNNRGRNI